MKKRGDLCTSLCVVISGSVGIYDKESRLVDMHHRSDLLEAPEWVRSNLNPEEERFKVSMRAERFSDGQLPRSSSTGGCGGAPQARVVAVGGRPPKVPTVDVEYLKWPRETLVQLLRDNPRILTAMRAVLGIQTARVWTRMMTGSWVPEGSRTAPGSVLNESNEPPNPDMNTATGLKVPKA